MAKKKRKPRVRNAELEQKATLDNRALGLRVLQLRDKLGLTTTELARKVGMSQAQISRLENGKQGFRSHTLAKIAEVLGVKPIYFFLGDADIRNVEVVRDTDSLYGPGVPDELKEALRSPRFKRFASKSARIFMENDAAFSRITSLVRSTKM
ncbi:MAG TPA: XRE family transcriptional regulator [Planctomycetes bacterium]|nr:XRE family transcriptional regulator [Planctomycetota bacterium]